MKKISQLPSWIKKRYSYNKTISSTTKTLEDLGVNTVCQNAHCPNIVECFSKKTATFMILGRVCTRNCAFCAVSKGAGEAVDVKEPHRLVAAANTLGLKHIVITSVTRDDLPDGGAVQFASCIREIRRQMHNTTTVEVLTPDFKGKIASIDMVTKSFPNIFNHNLETVSRLYPLVRPQADYLRSLSLLERVKMKGENIYTKSGIMVGLGESYTEVIRVMKDLINSGCDMLTIGQYLSPTSNHLPVKQYIEPAIFEEYRIAGHDLGFIHVASAPLVRSSYNASDFFME